MKKCNKRRDLFNLFTYYSCVNCNGILKDEEIVCEGKRIDIYYLSRFCEEVKYTMEEVANDINLKKFLVEAYNNKDLVLWLSIKERYRINQIIEVISQFNMSVHILFY